MAANKAAPRTPPTTPPIIFLLLLERPDELPPPPLFITLGVELVTEVLVDTGTTVAWPFDAVLVLKTTMVLVLLLCSAEDDLDADELDELVELDEDVVVLVFVVEVLVEVEVDVEVELVEVVDVSVGLVGVEFGVEIGRVGVPVPGRSLVTCLLNKAPSPSCISGKYGEAEV